ncbi:MAG: uncharacterized protein QOF20_1235 [Acidimicrobiaceae bacterium]|nr:uncharacterized protein [Acidimicrobiaceae bacterium]MDQ1363999.1 uncharacterized protein [Acidimicrobiaceae bacterium]MDQ1368882.1 uncharacterized protein [Acidimicrobiaceae bacterium]MDQ1399298.1 uncharacterized protein [Acidimicrobiaceae bacterium]MDQ1413354.1 uncharacterized protein [Acidimicrobiaceae bacterium]
MHAAAVHFDLHLPQAHSLKDKRAIIRPILEGCRRRYQVAAAEVDHQDAWQRAGLGVSAVSATAGHLCEVLDQVERFVWSFPEVEVIGAERRWLEEE